MLKWFNFQEEHREPILDGDKWKTWRLKKANIQLCSLLANHYDGVGGDRLGVKIENEPLAHAEIENSRDLTISEAAEGRHKGHMNYETEGELIVEMNKYYPDERVEPESELVEIEWDPDTLVEV